VHRSYLAMIWPLLEADLVHGMAHITGGGLFDNLPRILPADTAVEIDRDGVPRPPIFDLLVEGAGLDEREAYRVFNMGFGMVLAVGADRVDDVLRILANSGERGYLVGEVEQGSREVRLR
jgi:phosphoribosylformylglycinamidine cyclo-ligase